MLKKNGDLGKRDSKFPKKCAVISPPEQFLQSKTQSTGSVPSAIPLTYCEKERSMRKHNLISLIYANLEKTSAAVEEAAQTNASRPTLMHACRCDRWGHACTASSEHPYTQQVPSLSVLLAK
jgi:hypothetical protein